MTDTQQPTTISAPAPEQPAKGRNVVGIIALVASVLGFLFAVIPGAYLLGWILLPIGFILSLVALFLRDKKKGLAIAALIVSIVGTIAGVVAFTVTVATAFDEAFDTETSVVTEGDEPVAEEAASEEVVADDTAAEVGTRDNPAPLGSAVTGDEYTVVINSFVADATQQVLDANQFNEAPPAGSVYALVNATITYTGAESGMAAFAQIDYVTAGGEVVGISDNTSLAVAPEPTLGFDELYNGGTVTGNIVLQLPAGDAGALRVTPGMFADEVFVAIQ